MDFRLVIVGLFFLLSCNETSDKDISSQENPSLQFEELSPAQSGIDFSNNLDLSQLKSPIQYINVYNGGGVSIGDINNDDLPDVYLTGNLSENKLYLNEGNLKFKEITTTADVAATDSWSFGSTMADVNNDPTF